MKSVAIVTHADLPDIVDADNLLVEPMRAQGFEVQAKPWDKDGIDWKQYDALIFRSAWNYHKKVQLFNTWLDQIEQLHIPTFNSLSTIRWNLNKRYLEELKNKGIPVISTIYSDGKTVDTLITEIRRNGWEELVVKPVYGASSDNVIRLKTDEFTAATLSPYRYETLIQPLMSEIQSEGEYSFIFIGNEYSHAILKTPRAGEFRINHSLGGTQVKATPSSRMLNQVASIYKTAGLDVLFARIDCLNVDGQMTLMELEVIDPYLHFDVDENSAPRFAEAFAKQM
jgi:glutathione synthase/RimK-type ligase-like ATP-grasp enzyme